MNKNTQNPYIHYTSLGMQMLLTIGAGTYLGYWADQFLGTRTPWFTVAGSLFFTLASLVWVVVRLQKEQQDQPSDETKAP
jgi:F0F1-type ATP synthase assembly protein I